MEQGVIIIWFKRWVLVVLILLLCLGQGARTYGEGDDDVGGTDESELTLMIHLVPHSHVDAGFLETSDASFENSVNTILHKVLDQLENDVNRRFVWAETLFFRRWYSTLNQGDKERVRRAVNDGQLEFVGGGVVEHDEALTTWESVVDQLTLGHDWIERNFGEKARPRVGWQIDAAGHSDATPAILSMMGYEALVINHVHYRVKQQFKSQKHLEFVWRGSNLGHQSSSSKRDNWQMGDIFTHILYQDFMAPEGYDFESGKGVRQVTNAKRRADRLVHTLREWAASYRTHHLLVPFGDRLRFQEADKQFTNMEKLMRYINEKVSDVGIRFSTASEYVQSVRETAAVTGLEFPRFSGDFFPYADNKDSYWSGLFSARQSFKEACRHVEGLVRSADLFFALARAKSTVTGDLPRMKSIRNGLVEADTKDPLLEWDTKLYQTLENARLAVAHMAHHHAISGSSRTEVINDYMAKLQEAETNANIVLEAALGQLLSKHDETHGGAGTLVRPSLSALPFNLMDTSSGSLAESGHDDTSQHPIIVYNHDAVRRFKVVEVFLGEDWNRFRHVQVVNTKGESIRAQIYHHIVSSARTDKGNAKKKKKSSGAGEDNSVSTKVFLTFLADVPPLGFTTYFCHLTSARERIKQSHLTNAATPTTRILRFQNGKLLKRDGTMKSENEEEYDEDGGSTKNDRDEIPVGSFRSNKLQQQQQQQQGRFRGGSKSDSDSRDGTSREIVDGLEYADRVEERMVKLENHLIQTQVDCKTGLLHSILDKRTTRNTLLRQQYYQYPGTKSGTFLLRPDKPEKVSFDDAVTVAITKGPIFEQVQVISNNGIGQVVRVYKHSHKPESLEDSKYDPGFDIQGFVEVKHVVAPELGMDTVMRYETNMDTDGTFYTDNALNKLIKRSTHRDTPLASNVYPASACAALRDTQATSMTRLGQVLMVASKTPFGVSSPFTDSGTGSLEIMVHRNHENDDGRGLGEPLSDFTMSHMTTMLAVDTPNGMIQRMGHIIDRVQRPCEPFFALERAEFQQILSRENWASRFNLEQSFLDENAVSVFDSNKMSLVSIQARDPLSDQLVLRFTNHAETKSDTLSLNALFDQNNFKVRGSQQCTLSGGPPLKLKFGDPFKGSSAQSGGSSSFEYLTASGTVRMNSEDQDPQEEPNNNHIVLYPNEIRTIMIDLVALQENEKPTSMYGNDKSQQKQQQRKKRKKLKGENQGDRLDEEQHDQDGINNNNGDVNSLERSDEDEKMQPRRSRKELEETAEEHKSHIEAMQRRVKMYKSNIDQLLADIDRFDKQGKKQLKEATVQDLKNAEASLQQAKSSLEESQKELASVLAEIQVIDHTYKIGDSDLLFEDQVRIREAEATVHGAVAGAAAMLLFVVAGNWIFSGGFKLVRGYVPISFGFAQHKDELPTHKVN